jgi:hypothetical protein
VGLILFSNCSLLCAVLYACYIQVTEFSVPFLFACCGISLCIHNNFLRISGIILNLCYYFVYVSVSNYFILVSNVELLKLVVLVTRVFVLFL